MIVETKDLMKVKSFAEKNKVSTTTVYNWVEKKSVELVEIDGVKFIKK